MGLADVIKNLVMKADENAVNFLHGKKADNTDTYNFVGLPAQDGSDKVVAEIGVSKNPRTGGFIEGFQENKNTPLSVLDNWGTPRPLNYRFGEIAGTTARGLGKIGEGVKKGLQVAGEIADSPLGRAGLVAGVVGLTGGSPLQALTYGANTGMINQANRMKDNLYRKELEKYGFDTSGVKGYIGDDTFNKYLQSKQLQENAEWRKANLKAQQDNQILLNLYRKDQLEQQRQQNAINNYYKSQDIAQGWERINIDKENKSKGKPLSDSQVKELNNTQQFLTALDNISDRYNNAKYDKLFGVGGDIKRNLPTSRYDADVSLFKQDVEILRQRYAKLLEGGRLSDSDRAFYQKALFNPNTSRKDFLEAIRRMKETLKQDYSNSLNMYQKQGKDISEFEMPSSFNSTPQTNTNVTTTQIGKYKVRVK